MDRDWIGNSQKRSNISSKHPKGLSTRKIWMIKANNEIFIF